MQLDSEAIGAVFAVLAREAGSDGIHFGLRQTHTGFQPHHRKQPALRPPLVVSVLWNPKRRREGPPANHPSGANLRVLKSGRHDTDHLGGQPAKLNGFSEQVRIALQMALPEFVAENDKPASTEGDTEAPANLRILVWIRNDRNSNGRLIQSDRDLDLFVSAFNQSPRPVMGVLQKPLAEVRQLTRDAYPGVNTDSLQVLWAREFPSQQSVNAPLDALARVHRRDHPVRSRVL